jgi:hypothetical protein
MLASIKQQFDPVDRSHDEMAELAARVFELFQTIRQQSLTADYPEKRRLLRILFSTTRSTAWLSALKREIPSTCTPKGFSSHQVGATGRLLNFFSREFGYSET